MSSDYIMQRRLQPIYDVLDGQNYKAAIQLCNKALKKSGPSAAIQALKAFAQSRSGYDEDALVLCLQVMATKPTDAPTLQALMMTLKTLDMKDELVVLYQQAFTAQPNNEEWANHWFMALVRINDLKGYQQAAMKLHKTFKETKYYFWAIMSIYLQTKTPGCSTKTLLLSLAEKMMEKSYKDGWILNSESLYLYLMILEEQSKFGEMEQLVVGELGELLPIDAERDHLLLSILMKKQSYESAIEVAKRLLKANIDDWISYESLVESLLKIDASPSRISEIWEMISALQKSALQEKHPCRGPFLAQLLLISKGLSISSEISISKYLLEYLERFGKAQSCFDDIKPYLSHVSKPDLRKIADTFIVSKPPTQTDGLSMQEKIGAIRRDINHRKVLRFLAADVLSPEECTSQFTKLLQCYHESIPLGENIDARELQPGDDYLIMSAEYALDSFLKKRDDQILIQAIGLLEFGLEKSKHSHQFKLLLIRLYLELGVFQRAVDLASSMDIKQVQTDTLCYIFTDDLENYGAYSQAVNQFLLGLVVHARNDKEVPEAIIQAYKHASFSKIPEFLRFQERLSNSVQRAHFQHQIIRAETISRANDSADLCQYLDDIDPAYLECDDAKLNDYHDNRDLTVLLEIGHPCMSLASKIVGTAFPKAVTPWCKGRSLVIRVLRKLISSTTTEPDVASLEDQLEAVANTMLDVEATPAKMLVQVSRLVRGCTSELSDEMAWQETLSTYKCMVNAVAESSQFGLSRELAASITGMIEASTYLYMAMYASGPALQLSKKAKGKDTSRGIAFTNAREAYVAITTDALKTIDTRLSNISQMSSSQFCAHLQSQPPGFEGDLMFLADTQV
ncbi:hypothetical protein BASA60_002250 [Batrachochytrium salamandrivorans]|nr:hypothetical protein BASA62_000884 [Batrachochytrium salamandrivorans]KAH6581757.1 hypothetical protein BASA60_002250 [Batrachochytrium salamandrivorans]KAH9272401.1 hypothetical protein BASA83_005207 [Batrachochytrium salamandrivorans]